MKNLGYTPKSGAGSVTYGALKRFGLLEDVEGRRAKLSPLGIDIVRGETTGQRDFDKLRKAALLPKVHKEIWEQYGADLPADSVIEFDLQQKGFTSGGAAEFLGEWKRTMIFAKLAEEAATVSDEPAEPPDSNPESSQMLSPTPDQKDPPKSPQTEATSQTNASQTLRFPLLGGKWASLSIPIPMTEEAWDNFMGVLQSMKAAATQPPSDSDS